MKNVLVAGASGYLGRHLLRALAQNGYRVTALVRNPARLQGLDVYRVIRAEVTKPETLTGTLNNIDCVISAVGITKQKDGLTYIDVDYQANANLLLEAKQAGIKKFIYVSVLHGQQMKDLKMVAAKEQFAEELGTSGMNYQIIRPNGFFSDMEEVLAMASKGQVWLFGDGTYQVNPIHGADLADFIVANMADDNKEWEVGGPDLMTHNEIANIAFEVTGKPPRISHVPIWLKNTILKVLRLFTGQRTYGPVEFFMTVMTRDMIGPQVGSHHLKDNYMNIHNNERAKATQLHQQA